MPGKKKQRKNRVSAQDEQIAAMLYDDLTATVQEFKTLSPLNTVMPVRTNLGRRCAAIRTVTQKWIHVLASTDVMPSLLQSLTQVQRSMDDVLAQLTEAENFLRQEKPDEALNSAIAADAIYQQNTSPGWEKQLSTIGQKARAASAKSRHQTSVGKIEKLKKEIIDYCLNGGGLNQSPLQILDFFKHKHLAPFNDRKMKEIIKQATQEARELRALQLCGDRPTKK